MSRRIKTAEQSARRDQAMTKGALLTIVADSAAPRDPRARGDYYRAHLIDSQRTVEILQQRIAEVEAERDRIKSEAEYNASLCVTRTEAEAARSAAFRLARGKAALLAEAPGHVTTGLSDAIESIPDPQPKWR